ncbi:hypothetical protein MRY82_06920 [bacterium]|nr:hypothetical protein [bacterium]
MRHAALAGLFVGFLIIAPDGAYAFGGFESKMSNLTGQLIGVVLPLMSVLGLIYAAFLSISGSAEAKGKIFAVITASAIGFMAPQIIAFIQSAAG